MRIIKSVRQFSQVKSFSFWQSGNLSSEWVCVKFFHRVLVGRHFVKSDNGIALLWPMTCWFWVVTVTMKIFNGSMFNNSVVPILCRNYLILLCARNCNFRVLKCIPLHCSWRIWVYCVPTVSCSVCHCHKGENPESESGWKNITAAA